MSELQQKLQQEIEAHNELHQNVTAGKEQLANMEKELDRRFGRITILQELLQAEQQETPDEGPVNPEGPVLAAVPSVAPEGEPEVEGVSPTEPEVEG